MLSRQETSTQKFRILVVEDEGIIARDITAMLENLGYEVTGQAGTGAEAIDLASIVANDLVLMDIKIRGPIDGVQTAEELRSRFGLPVVFLTAHADSETLNRANKTQPFGYIVKPFSEADLKVAIEVGLNRYRLQREVEEKHTWVGTALESISDAVIATDSNWQIALFNAGAEQMLGWKGETALRKSIHDVVQLRDGEGNMLARILEEALTSDIPIALAGARVQHQDGTERFVMGSLAPMRRDNSRVVQGVVIILRDLSKKGSPVTDPSKHLQELSRAISHDLREPVRNISCFAQLLKRNERTPLDEASREYLDFIVEGSKRIDGQLSALMKFHLAGNPSRDHHESSALNCCNDALASLAPQIQQQKARIDIVSLPTLPVFPGALSEVFEQLISNALRFRSEQIPQIKIGALQHGLLWEFSVEDNGLGFEVGQTERIFELFAKAHEPNRCGLGAGLAICRRLIEGFGGRIWAESKPGETRFHFTVPVKKPQVVAA